MSQLDRTHIEHTSIRVAFKFNEYTIISYVSHVVSCLIIANEDAVWKENKRFYKIVYMNLV